MNAPIFGTLALGFALGIKHALDADHLIAVSTIVGRERSVWKASWVGVIWGMGHTASLFVAAVAVILLKVTISPAVAQSLEFCVGGMLMILGADLVRRVARGDLSIHSHPHAHGEEDHAHVHVHMHDARADHDAHHGAGRRPFLIGLVHGLAGSAALMLFVLTTITSPWAGLLYVTVFGAGTICGMCLMSLLMSLPLAVAARRLSGVLRPLQIGIGVGSFAFGAVYAWTIARTLFG